jgi:hypothetical protein
LTVTDQSLSEMSFLKLYRIGTFLNYLSKIYVRDGIFLRPLFSAGVLPFVAEKA